MRRLVVLALIIVLVLSLSVPAFAVDSYTFASENTDEFYQPGVSSVTYDGVIPGYVQNIYDFTPQTVYDSRFGATIIAPELDEGYGLGSQKPSNAPGSSSGSGSASEVQSAGTASNNSTVPYPDTSGNGAAAQQYALTPVEDVRNTDGSMGVLRIPAINMNVTAYDGDTYEAMKKGIGHISSTSCWNSNIGLISHNRGANTNFGRLKELKAGDTLTYTTKLGTREYVVTFAGKIASNDWSYLQYTSDNRITLITCVADQPQYRLCVQAVEKVPH